MATRIDIKPATVSKEVSLSVGDVGVLNLSGIYKPKAQDICDKWNSTKPGVVIKHNTFGKQTGFVVESKDGKLVGFLNMFSKEVISLEDAIEAFMKAKFDIYVSVVDMDQL